MFMVIIVNIERYDQSDVLVERRVAPLVPRIAREHLLRRLAAGALVLFVERSGVL